MMAVAHVAAHELGAAAYVIKAVRAAASEGEVECAGRLECQWQREQLPRRFETSCLMTSGCATVSAGRCSTVNTPPEAALFTKRAGPMLSARSAVDMSQC